VNDCIESRNDVWWDRLHRVPLNFSCSPRWSSHQPDNFISARFK
jgi:hypothetical protein